MSDCEEVELSPEANVYREKVDQLLRQRDLLVDALAKCDPEDEIFPTDSLRTVVERVSRTLDALKSRSVKLNDLAKFRVKVTIPKTSSKKPAHIAIRVDQLPTSKPLERNDYVVITPPVGKSFTGPLVPSKWTTVNYAHSFDLPDRSQKTIAFAKTAIVEVAICHFTSTPELGVGTGKHSVIATAKVQVLPMCFAAVRSAQPLEFKTPDGKKSEYVFGMTMLAEEPLMPVNGLCIDEQVELIRE